MIEALRPLMEKLKEKMDDPRAKRIQSWVERLSANPNEAKLVHNRAIEYIKKYNNDQKMYPDDIYTDAIQIANFRHDKNSNFPPFSEDVYTTKTRMDMGADKSLLKENILEYSKEILIASLFSVNRLDHGDRLSKSMELDQIQAVIKCVIDNNHIQMGTGQGKSSIVIPIVSIINSLTSEEGNSLVVSINKNLVSELESKTRSLIKKTNESGRRLLVFTDNKSKEEISIGEQTKVKMMKESLVTSENKEYSAEVQNELFGNYWGEEIDTKIREAEKMFESLDTNTKITFMSKDDFVFKIAQGGRSFIEYCPKVFFDEVDAPYITGETYQTTQEDMYVSPENFRVMTTQYVLNHLVMAKIDPEEDFEVYKGKGTASEEVKEKLLAVNWKDWAEGKAKDTDLETAFESSTKTICKFLNLNEAETFTVQRLIRKQLTENVFVGDAHTYEEEGEISLFNASITGAAENLADAYHSLNKLYINEGEKIVVRSSYFDQLLENHKFEPDIHLAMLALVNKFTPVNLNPKAAESVKFPTIIAELGSKLIGFSGTLIQRDLRTGKNQASSLAGLLRTYTGHEVFEVRSPETKKPPPPIIIENKDEMKRALVETIKSNKDGKPILLLSHYDIKTTKEIFFDLARYFPNSFDIEILPSIPSDLNRLEKYYQELKKKTRNLANGRTKILLSTGSAGIGADIIETSGAFPDIKIGILGLPENESLVRQNLGRRRKKGSDSFWIVDKESLRERSTWLDEQANMIVKASLTPIKAQEIINKLPYSKEEQNLNFVLRLIHDAHSTTLSNEDIAIGFDKVFEKTFFVRARDTLIERIKKEYFSTDIDWEHDKKSQRKLNELTRIFGLPDTLYNDLTQAQLTLGIQAKSGIEFIMGLVNEIEKQGIIETKIDDWFEHTRRDAEFIYKYFYGDGKQNINQILLEGTPKDATFHSASKIPYTGKESKTVEIGYASLPLNLSINQFPVSIPAVKFTQGEEESVYLIRNTNIGQMRQIKQLYSYEKGRRSYLFTPIAA